jgi:hypothetical protein
MGVCHEVLKDFQGINGWNAGGFSREAEFKVALDQISGLNFCYRGGWYYVGTN